jgi:very-short-patch-repair endonuclease
MPRKTHFEQERLAELLRRQHFVIGWDQALACGLTKKALAYRLRAGGPWQRLIPGVYLAGIGTASAEQRDMAALLHAGPRSVLTGLAALRRQSFRVPAPSVVSVLVPAEARRQSVGFVQVQRTKRMPTEVCVAGEVRFVLAARAVGDAARGLRVGRDVRALVAQAVQQRRCSIAQLVAELEEGPVWGSGLLRAALAEVKAGIRSVPEGDLRVLLRRGRVPEPLFNARLYVGNALIAEVDAWWPEAGVAAEVDSREYHYSAEDWQRTMGRHDRLVARGVLLLHFTPRQIRTEPEEVVGQIRAALAQGRARPRLGIVTRPAA